MHVAARAAGRRARRRRRARRARRARIEVHDVDGRPLEVSLSDGELRVGYAVHAGRLGRASSRSSATSAARTRPTCTSRSRATSRAKVGTVSADGLLAGVARGRLGVDRLGHARHRRHARRAWAPTPSRARSSCATTRGDLQAQHGLGRARGLGGAEPASRPTRSPARSTARRRRPGPPRDGDDASPATSRSACPTGTGVQVEGRSPCPGGSSSTARSTRAPTPGHRKVDLRTGDGDVLRLVHARSPGTSRCCAARGTGVGVMMAPVFAHGQLRLYLLSLLESGPKHGYELITALSDRFGGTYRPSPGTVYPRLARLEEEGLVARVDEERKSTYALTDAGLRRARGASRRPGAPRGGHRRDGPGARRAGARRTCAASMRGLRADLAAAAQQARAAAVPHTAARPPDDPRLASHVRSHGRRGA